MCINASHSERNRVDRKCDSCDAHHCFVWIIMEFLNFLYAMPNSEFKLHVLILFTRMHVSKPFFFFSFIFAVIKYFCLRSIYTGNKQNET